MAKKLDITKFEVKNTKIPTEFDGFKMLQITDLHNKVFGKNNEILIRKIDEVDPDIIVLTGDLITGEGESYTDNIELLRKISDKYPTYSVLGNHEQEAIVGKYSEYYKDYFNEIKKLSITHLENEHVKIYKNESFINLYGLIIPLEYYPHALECLKKRIPHVDNILLGNVLEKANQNEFNVMLAHNPLYFDDYAQWNLDLVLSGHVHGGMIRIPGLGGLLSPERRFFPKYDWGKFKVNGTTLVLSKGLGGGGFIPRIMCTPEIVCITLKK